MSQRELLQRAFNGLEALDNELDVARKFLLAEIRHELKSPEPVECGVFEVKLGMMMPLLPDGRYKLLAVRIEDE